MLNMLTILAQAGAPVNDGGGGGAGLLLGGGLFALVILALAVISLVLWVWALIDAIRNPALSDTERIIWVLVIIFLQVLGAIVYLIVGRKKGVAGPAKGY